MDRPAYGRKRPTTSQPPVDSGETANVVPASGEDVARGKHGRPSTEAVAKGDHARTRNNASLGESGRDQTGREPATPRRASPASPTSSRAR